MVNTIKFSQFTAPNLNDPSLTSVGLSSGVNVIDKKFFSWTTATRPLSPYNGLLGLNTDLELYEYWNSVSLAWVQLVTSESGINWAIITDVSQDANTNSGYITNRTSTPVSIVLPALFMPGDLVEVMGLGAGGWSLVANALQNIQFGSVATSTAGAISSDIQYANITVRGLVTNTTWSVISTNSNPTYV